MVSEFISTVYYVGPMMNLILIISVIHHERPFSMQIISLKNRWYRSMKMWALSEHRHQIPMRRCFMVNSIKVKSDFKKWSSNCLLSFMTTECINYAILPVYLLAKRHDRISAISDLKCRIDIVPQVSQSIVWVSYFRVTCVPVSQLRFSVLLVHRSVY